MTISASMWTASEIRQFGKLYQHLYEYLIILSVNMCIKILYNIG